jgi:2-C-methyl-D-erythritol 4-phosphate cytidylyltransferase
LIPAAGSGARLPGGRAKQYAELAGRPMLWHAVRAVCVPAVEKVLVVLAPEDAEFAKQDWSAFEGRIEPLYCGGRLRRESVYNGLVASSDAWEAEDWMLVHDAARPCLPSEDLRALIAEGAGDDIGAILAVPAAETVKKAAKDEAGGHRVASTENRAELWLAQTPQMFRAGLLVHALQRARGEVTDESSAIEQLGLRPRLVAGSRENIKVTWPEDLAMAESILRRRAELSQ